MRKPTHNLVVAGQHSRNRPRVRRVNAGGACPAAASQASKPSTSVLLPVAAAKAAGFTTVVTAPGTSKDTGVTGCPYGAREDFASATGNLGLESEVLYCYSAADSETLLKGLAFNGEAEAGLKAPKSLDRRPSSGWARIRPTSSPGAAAPHSN